MKPLSFFNKGVTVLAAFLVLNAAALSYLPVVHDAVHTHEDHGSLDSGSSSKDLCSAQNHLAADLSAYTAPRFEALRLPETASLFHETRPVFFIQPASSPRAPPVSPVHP